MIRLMALGLAFVFGIVPLVWAAEPTYVRIQSADNPALEVNNETGALSVTATEPGWFSAQWAFEPIPFADNQYWIQNRWKGTYLNNETGPPALSDIGHGWHSARWVVERVGSGRYSIKNSWKGTFLQHANGALQLSTDARAGTQWTLSGFIAGALAGADAVYGPVAAALARERHPSKVAVLEIKGISGQLEGVTYMECARPDNSASANYDSSSGALTQDWAKCVGQGGKVTLGVQVGTAGFRAFNEWVTTAISKPSPGLARDVVMHTGGGMHVARSENCQRYFFSPHALTAHGAMPTNMDSGVPSGTSNVKIVRVTLSAQSMSIRGTRMPLPTLDLKGNEVPASCGQ
jgi:hypothetical protein